MSEKDWNVTKRNNAYTLFDADNTKVDWIWDLHQEVLPFDKMWKEGESVFEISRILKKDLDSVRLLKMDRMKKGKIKQRPYDDYGNVETFLKEFGKTMRRRKPNV